MTLNLRLRTSAMRTVGLDTTSNSGTVTLSPKTLLSGADPFEDITVADTSISLS